MATVEQRLSELGISLPQPAVPVANYRPWSLAQSLVSVSGQLPIHADGAIIKGTLGADLSLEDGIAAARQCAINIVAQLKAACEGDLERIAAIVRLGGFVNCRDDFVDQPRVINGASDLMVEVFGEAGRHSRAAVGVNSLPLGAAVEVDGLALLKS